MSQNSTFLSSSHLEELEGSSILPEVMEARGYRTLSGSEEDKALLEEMGFSKAQAGRDEAFPALLLPLYGASGDRVSAQLKPSQPRVGKNNKPIKYETPRGTAMRIDIPEFTRGHLKDLEKPLWVTEGLKKVDSLVSHGMAALGILGVYNWRNQLGSLGDWEDIPLKGRTVVVCFDADTSSNPNVMRAMVRFGRWLRSRGAKPNYVIVPASVGDTPVKGVDDYFAAGGTPMGLKEVATTNEPNADASDSSFADAKMADAVADEVFGGKVVYTPGMGWMVWTGKYWKRSEEPHVVELVRRWAIDGQAAALDRERRESGAPGNLNVLDGWRSMLDANKIRRVVGLAKGIVIRDDEELDQDRDLLNVQNGVVDLRTGDLLPHDPARLMTRIAGADYDPDAYSADWEKILEAVPQSFEEWLQMRAGQAATGYTPDDNVVPILWGNGGNGKSTYIAALESALGTYAIRLPGELVVGKAARDESMRLRGARLATVEETENGSYLNANAIKTLTGHVMTGHHLYQSSMEWKTSHSLLWATNYKPIVSETDSGTWRRLALVTIGTTFRTDSSGDAKADPTLRPRAEQGDPEIIKDTLRWIVEGAVAWFENERAMCPMPKQIEEANREWRKETDLMLGYWDDVLEPAPGRYVVCQDMLAEHNDWRQERGHERKITDRAFSSEFGNHSETKRHKVEKKKIRAREGYSPRPGSRTGSGDVFGSTEAPAPTGPRAVWLGVKFRER